MNQTLLSALHRLINPLALAPQQKTDLLRNLLAKNWLQQLNPQAARQTSWDKLVAPLPATLSPDILKALLACLHQFPAGHEGDKHAFTPEIFGLITQDKKPALNRKGVVYTPFETAYRLAQETLYAWLQRHGVDTTRLDSLPPAQARQVDSRLAHLTVCDPAAGAGGLIIPFWFLLAQLRKKLNPTLQTGPLLAHIATHNLYAADIAPQATANLRLRLQLTLLAHGQTADTSLHIFTHDSLAGHTVWENACPEIFANGGFDIFLSNPPYIGQKNNKEIFARLRQNPQWATWITPKTDLLYLFFHLAFELLKPGGTAGLLTTSYFTHAVSAYALRKRLNEQATLLRLIDFGEERIFKQAKGQHNLITVFMPQLIPTVLCRCGAANRAATQKELFFGPELFLETCPPEPALKTALAKMAATPHKLKELARISNGLMTGCDQAFVLTYDEKKALNPSRTEQKKIKPFFKNSDISAYVATQQPRYFLIDFFYPNDRQTDFSRYPRLLQHLARFKQKLLTRRQNNNGIDKQLAQGKYWFGSVRRKFDFEGEKIVVPQRSAANRFAYSIGPWYASSDVYFISAPHPPLTLWYLLALFNSATYYVWLFYKGKRKGNLLELYAQPLGEMPIPIAPPQLQRQLEALARNIYTAKQKNLQADTLLCQHEIDRLVFGLFQFSNEEIHIIFDKKSLIRK
ncbi:MAG: N-6 DNA methylase [Elusimicrobiaceae bacterium]|nr:N-6 DNA methylase [Elusimicrobiaceae bacterium]